MSEKTQEEDPLSSHELQTNPAPRPFRRRVLDREVLAGTFVNMGSSISVEIAGQSGFDWVLIDREHGIGGQESLIHQLQAASATTAAPIVRIPWNDPQHFKRVLDLGAAGIMVPYVSSASEAEQAVASMRFPPHGIRGVAKLNRASRFGQTFEEYFAHAHELLLTVVQIETAAALASIDAIAATAGVDVLFVGPLDLSVSLGVPQQFDHPRFKEACRAVAAAAAKARKAAGILLTSVDQIDATIEAGFTFVALGSDSGLVAGGMRDLAAAFDHHRRG